MTTNPATKWRPFFDPKGDIGGIEDESGRMIIKFNYHLPPIIRAAITKNILWVQGSILSDARSEKYTYMDHWKNLFQNRKNEF